MAVLVALTSCSPPPSPVSIKSKVELNGPADLTKKIAANPRWRAFQLKTFQLNHVWSGPGRKEQGGEPYRAKLTLWDFSDDGSPIAEVYFHDPGQEVPNPDPNTSQRPFKLHFPIGAVGPIFQTLRNANEAVYLYYFEDLWGIGIGAPEPVGVD
jgi:hypothetical protein